ncbi:hydroxysteroid dehydrogenase-like protein 2 [Penaeus chinensis]|uniref:hydroxysteroid dehydrogenase-like protein 2 n=1 Tax=Penaeus chinensis TaxID=139456 RepID=UPI001FB6AFE3|nr:hydroxysteroid dehydrogenase-like protein 2 [Penaeus chinensis]
MIINTGFKLCIPHLVKSLNPHILNISAPLNMHPRWFKEHVAYIMAKYGMSICASGMNEESRADGIELWPRTAIITAAMEMIRGDEVDRQCQKPEIMADAAYVMPCKD